jgi:hypothetical protein
MIADDGSKAIREPPESDEAPDGFGLYLVQIIYPFRMIILYASILNFTVTTRAHHASAAVRPLENQLKLEEQAG